MRAFGEWLDTTTIPVWALLLLTVGMLIAVRLAHGQLQAWREARCRRDGHRWEAVGDDVMWCRRCHYTTARIHGGGGRGRRI